MKIICILLTISIYSLSFARAPLFPLKGSMVIFYVWSTSEYYWTTDNFDSSGNSQGGLPYSNQLTNLKQTFDLQYLFYPRLSAFTSLAFSYVKSENFDPNNDNTRFNQSFSDWDIGLRYHLINIPFHLTPEITVTLPLNEVSTKYDDSIVGDGTLKYGFGSWFEKQFGVYHFYARLFLNFDSGELADQFHWKFGARSFFAKIFHAGIGLSGNTPISDDDYTNNTGPRITFLDKVNAGSFKYYYVNSETISFNIWSGIRLFSKWYFILGYEKSFAGRNSANGDSLLLQVQLKASKGIKTRSFFKKKYKNYKDVDYEEDFYTVPEELPKNLISD
jgi:hypothetical protein